MELRVRREMKELSSVLAMSEEFCRLNEVDGENRNGVDFVLEELFTNAVKHCPEREDELLILLDRLSDEVRVSLTDFDADRFDIREAAQTDTNLPLEERTPGGLGIQLIMKIADRIEYDFHDRVAKTTIFKRLV